ncbi:nucleoside-diphosphate-sugar epimerase [Paecilomyces variotii No. 5]|uniref:Nucleoside-diphosphate-sugar epimerase n=1 Tax=Byssochlamys spectabilis (strain No. 5 / NBRC 109023) TaxID=1356009 RepID=V5FQN6_BYSSN|nr:nucleoside-diphosphate-sugar epimerase [Paecilomyces variotii No. 5]
MAPKVFLTGASGYIGGDVLYAVSQAHPDWEITALVRSKDKAAQITSKYPKIKIAHGDLDAKDLIEEEVKNADIVYHCADCDHVASAEAIAKGAAHHTPEKPLWLIHTSGTGILTIEDQRAKTIGIERPKEYNDWDGVQELLNLPDDAFHRNVDKIIIGAWQKSPDSVKVAVVCPPTIYGPGRGPVNTKSIQAYLLAAAVLKRKKGFLVGEGKNVWHQVHVQDLSNVYLALGDAAAAGGGKATWNDAGYYLAENGSFVWGDIERAVAKVAHEKKLIDSADVDQLNMDQVAALHEFGPYAWGSNSRGHAIRARKLFGWNPQQPKLIDLIPEVVDVEAKAAGLA